MTALLISGVFGLALGLLGAGLARLGRPDGRGLALNATLALAAAVVVAGDAASLSRHRGWVLLAVLAAIGLAGWLWPAHGAPRRSRAWPPANSALGLGLLALALAVPLLIFPVPLDTDAQGFGYLALMVRDGGTLNSLAPWHPEIAYLYSPGALLLFATLSQLFPFAPMSAVMMGAAHVAVFFFVWLAWELGGELALQIGSAAGGSRGQHIPEDHAKWKWAAAISAGLSAGLWSAALDSHYTGVFGLLFALATLTSHFRCQRAGRITDALLAALAAAATVITHVDTAIALALAFVAWAVLTPLAIDRPSPRRWLVGVVAIPAAAAAMIGPWLSSIWPLLGAGARSPFPVSLAHWRVLIFNHGLVWPALALAGAAICLRRRWSWALMMMGWLALTVELSTVGILERTIPSLGERLLRFDYPFSLAWHGPIIPYLTLGASALVWFAKARVGRFLTRWVRPLAPVSAIVLVAVLILRKPVLGLSRNGLEIYGAFASENDVAAMRWLRDHAPAEARVLNYPGDYRAGRDWEAHWAPVIAERDCVYFRRQPFFLSPEGEPIDPDGGYAEQLSLLAFWRNPADPRNRALLQEAGIDFVLVPESVADPGSWERSWRWRPPALVPDSVSEPSQAPYLEMAFASGGAQVYRLLP